ncbi:MAG: hypothetical protein MJE77_18155 [Proteobacteria bacterium]|nr:hypothetical protein [Pseudomonadota bacterium]
MYGNIVAALALAFLATGCPTVDLGDFPPEPGQCRPDQVYFRNVIWTEFLAATDPQKSCVAAAGCHRRDDGRSSLRLNFDPAQPTTLNGNENYGVAIRFLNCADPESSSLLTKPLSGLDPHGGGDLFDTGSPEYATFIQWFNL